MSEIQDGVGGVSVSQAPLGLHVAGAAPGQAGTGEPGLWNIRSDSCGWDCPPTWLINIRAANGQRVGGRSKDPFGSKAGLLRGSLALLALSSSWFSCLL